MEVLTLSLYSTFLVFIETHGFTQIVDFPSRGNNIVDIFVQIDLLSFTPAIRYQE